ncbi:hypothetical protein QTP88_007654 [Uroleucon formosanum]
MYAASVSVTRTVYIYNIVYKRDPPLGRRRYLGVPGQPPLSPDARNTLTVSHAERRGLHSLAPVTPARQPFRSGDIFNDGVRGGDDETYEYGLKMTKRRKSISHQIRLRFTYMYNTMYLYTYYDILQSRSSGLYYEVFVYASREIIKM